MTAPNPGASAPAPSAGQDPAVAPAPADNPPPTFAPASWSVNEPVRRPGHGRHPTDQRAAGREAAGQLIQYVHEDAFDPRPELKNALVDEGKAASEANCAGTHADELTELAVTGRAARLLYSVVHDLRSDQISALRIYRLKDSG